MAGTPTTAAGAASAASATAELAKIRKQLEEEANRIAEERAKAQLEAQKPKEEVQAFQKEIRKSPFGTRGYASDIGQLVRDQTRLNVFSNLKSTDKVDYYKFKNQLPADVSINMIGDKELRIQVETKLGSVVADSDPKSGNFKAWEKMQQGEFRLPPGEFVIKVTRTGNTEKKDAQNYALQIQAGSYKRDFDTIAREPRPGDGAPRLSQATMDLGSMLTSASSFVSSLPPIGTSATSKLSGLFMNGKF